MDEAADSLNQTLVQEFPDERMISWMHFESHFAAQQKLTQQWKTNILQLKIIKNKMKSTPFMPRVGDRVRSFHFGGSRSMMSNVAAHLNE